MPRLSYLKSFGIFYLCLVMGLPAFAQFSASLQGIVKDKTGSPIPGAQIKIVDEGTQTSHQATTNPDGLYRFNQLPSGLYNVEVNAQGFKSTTLNDVLVSANAAANANVTLELGSVQQSVTVSASTLPLLQTTNADTGTTLNSRDVETLPALGRDPYRLVRLAPGLTGTGAMSNSTGQAATLGNTTGPGSSGQGIFATENQVQVSAVGQRVTSNVYEIDGVSVNSLQWGGAAVVTPNSESVAEINVVSTAYDAALGRNSGAHTQITTKSGSNEFHGSGVFRFQDPGLNAYNKYGGTNNAPPVRVDTKFRQYAASLGGPIKKNKLFFFLSYEGLSDKSTTYGTTWQETPQFRSMLAQARPNSMLAKILSGPTAAPRVNAVLNGSCGNLGNLGPSFACKQYADGLDIGSFAPGVAPGNPYVADGPTNGGGLDGIPDLQFIQYYNPTHIVGNQYNARFDYNITSKDLLAGSAYVTKLNRVGGDTTTGARPSADTWFKPLSQAETLIYIRNFSPTIVNELRSNFTRYYDNGLTDNAGTNWGIPTVQVEGYTAINDLEAGGPFRSETTPAILAQNTYETRDTLTTIFGNHTIKYGAEFRWEQNNNNLLGGARPLYSFRGLWNWANDAPVFEEINEDPTTGQVATGQRYYRTRDYAGFIQDDWNVLPGLHVNLGLRWEYFSPVREARNRLTNVILGANGPQPVIDSRLVGVDRLYDPNYKNFMPKVAIAYSPQSWHDRLVLRAGFGTAYNRQNTVLFSNGAGNPPYFARFSICCGQATGTSPGSSPFAGGQIQYVFGSNFSPASYPPNAVIATGIDPRTGGLAGKNGQPGTPVEAWGAPTDLPDAYAIIYSFEAQAQLTSNMTLTLGYQGTGGRHLVRLVNQNFLYASSIPGTSIQAPFFAIYFPEPDTTSSYNAFNARVSRRFAKGFQLDAIYTWSKSIDYLSAEGPGAQTNETNPAQLATERGPSDFDSRHRFTLNGLWDLPIFPSHKGFFGSLFGGWQLGGIVTAYSGFPWTPVTGSLQSVAPVTGAATISPTRPIGYYGNAGLGTSNSDFINGSNFGGTSPTSAIIGTNYFDISSPGAPGIGRNSFRGPHYFSVDASASKRFALPITDRTALEIRANAYNVFNNLNLSPFTFGSDDTKVESANFGRAAAAYAGRVIEFQARFSF